MALTPEQIDTAYRKVWSTVPHAQRLSAFALEIETEVRKEYTELIRQMLDALDECKDSTQERIDTLTESGIDTHKPRYFRSYVQDLQRATDAISAARARLEGKP